MTDIIVLLGIAAFTAAYAALTAKIPVLEMGDPLGPKAFPIMIAIGMAISAVLLVLEMLRKRKAAKTVKTAIAPRIDQAGTRRLPVGQSAAVLCAFVLVFALYIALMEPLGFVVATALFLLAGFTLLNRKIWKTNVAVAVGFPLALYLLLAKLLGVALPIGILSI